MSRREVKMIWIDQTQQLVTFMLCGLIWTIQLVHYPAFSFVGQKEFRDFHVFHSRRISILVAILMPVELVCATVVAIHEPALLHLLGLALVLVIWSSTAFLQVPAHRAMANGFDVAAHRRLVRSNWVRTLSWSLRAILVF